MTEVTRYGLEKIVELTNQRQFAIKRNVYRETLRQLIAIFGNVYYQDSNGDLIKVKCTTGKQDRVTGKDFAENNLVLPYITIVEKGTSEPEGRKRNDNVLVNEVIWDEKEKRAKRVVSVAPKAVNIDYEINIWAKFNSDLDQIRYGILSLFNPALSVKTKYSDFTKAFIKEENDIIDQKSEDTSDRLVQKTISITVETYLPSPKFLFTNTGEIQSFNFDVNLQTGETEQTILRPPEYAPEGPETGSGGGGGGGITGPLTLSGSLDDVQIVNVQLGQVLVWDGSYWTASSVAGVGGGVTDHGQLTGLFPDNDHPQYVLSSTNLNLSSNVSSHIASASVHFTSGSLSGAYVLTSTNSNLSSLVSNLQTSTASISSVVDSHLASASVHFTSGSLSAAYVLTGTNLGLSTLVSNLQTSTASISSVVSNHIASSDVHFTSGSLSGSYVLTSTNLNLSSLVNNLQTSTASISSVVDSHITSASVHFTSGSLSAAYVLTSTNSALSSLVNNHIGSAVHWELSALNQNYINSSGDSANAGFYLSSVSSTNISATNYYNLPSGTAIWNANQLQSRNVATNNPANGDALVWNGSQWEPSAVSTGGGSVTNNPGGSNGDIQFKNGASFSGVASVNYDSATGRLNVTNLSAVNLTATNFTNAKLDDHIASASVHFTSGSLSGAYVLTSTNSSLSSLVNNLQVSTASISSVVSNHIASSDVHFTSGSLSSAYVLTGTNLSLSTLVSNLQTSTATVSSVLNSHIASGDVHFTSGSLSSAYVLTGTNLGLSTLVSNLQTSTASISSVVSNHIASSDVHFTSGSLSGAYVLTSTNSNLSSLVNNLQASTASISSVVSNHIASSDVHFTSGSLSGAYVLTSTNSSLSSLVNNLQTSTATVSSVLNSHIGSSTVHFTSGSLSSAYVLTSLNSSLSSLVNSHITSGDVHFTSGSLSGAYVLTSTNSSLSSLVNNLQTSTATVSSVLNSHITSAGIHFTSGSLSGAYVLTGTNLSLSTLVSNLQTSTASISSVVSNHIASSDVHFTSGSLSSAYVLTSTNSNLSSLVNNLQTSTASISSVVQSHIASADVHFTSGSLSAYYAGSAWADNRYVLSSTNTNLSSLVNNLQTSAQTISSTLASHIASSDVHFTSGSLSGAYVLTGTNLSLSTLVNNLQSSAASISSVVNAHLASAVHWELSALNQNYINASGDSASAGFYFSSVSAAGVSSFNISSTNLSSTNISANSIITGRIAVGGSDGYIYNDTGDLFISATNGTVRFNTGLSSTNISATNYINLPSASPIWNASAIKGSKVYDSGPFGIVPLAQGDCFVYITDPGIIGSPYTQPGWVNIPPPIFAQFIQPYISIDGLLDVDKSTTTPSSVSSTYVYGSPFVWLSDPENPKESSGYWGGINLPNWVTSSLSPELDNYYVSVNGGTYASSIYVVSSLRAVDLSATNISGTRVVASGLSSINISATNYYNLPSATITWKEAQDIVLTVRNETGSTLAIGTPVTISGVQGDVPIVTILSSVNTHVPEAYGFANHVAGLIHTSIDNNQNGHIVVEGIIEGTNDYPLNTSAFAAGDFLYVSSNGQLANTRPPAPYESHPVGIVLRSHPNAGKILVKIENSPELNDIVGFNLASSLIDGDIITYDYSTSTFINKQSVGVSGTVKGGTVSATTYLNLPVSSLSGLADVLISSTPTTNYVLKWNGTKWAPAPDVDTDTGLTNAFTIISDGTRTYEAVGADTLTVTSTNASITVTQDTGAPTLDIIVAPGNVNHNSLSGLTAGHPHTQYVLSSTNSSLSSLVTDHIASAVHWELSTLNNNYINASGDSASAGFYFSSLSATTISATNFSGISLSGSLRDVQITNPTNDYVLTWSATAGKWVPKAAPGSTGGISNGFAIIQDESANSLAATGEDTVRFVSRDNAIVISLDTGTTPQEVNFEVDEAGITHNSLAGLTTGNPHTQYATLSGAVFTGQVRAPSISATDYFNLPSGTAIWNANKLQGIDVSNVAPTANQGLVYNGTVSAWVPSSLPSGGSGSSYLSSLLDVSVVTPGSNQILSYDGLSGKWIPRDEKFSVEGALGTPVIYTDGFQALFDDSPGEAFNYAADTKTLSVQKINAAGISGTTISATNFSAISSSGTNIIATNLSATTVSATNYLNIPSGTAIWNANKLQTSPVSFFALSGGDLLSYDGTTWRNARIALSASWFTDVNISNPTNGQILSWSSTAGKWVAKDPGGGSGAPDGPNYSIQFNNLGSFSGSSKLVWNPTAQDLEAEAISATTISATDKWNTKFKLANETKTANTTFADDNTLWVDMAASKAYAVRANVMFSSTTAGDIKFNVTGTQVATQAIFNRRTIVGAATSYGNIGVINGYFTLNLGQTANGNGMLHIEGFVNNGGTASRFSIQWAQQASDAGGTTVFGGSYLEYRQLN